MKIALTKIFVFLTFFCFSQNSNIELLGNLDFPSSRGICSDIWGYVDQSGREYAVVSIAEGISISDVTDPNNPREIFYSKHKVKASIKDVKVWGDYAYLISEGGGGLMIVDMSALPNDDITEQDVTFFYGDKHKINSGHNLIIDENGILYIMGAGNNTIMLDLAVNPTNPPEVGLFNEFYIHDAFVSGDTLWACSVYSGFFAAIDLRNRSNPKVLFKQKNPGGITHSIWLSSDRKYAFVGSERPGGYFTSYDVSDLSDVKELDRILSKGGVGQTSEPVPHNVYGIHGNILVISWFIDGVVLIDASDPSNMNQIGIYDTSVEKNGCWGVYPYLPSGNIIASDMHNGLFILGPKYPGVDHCPDDPDKVIPGQCGCGVKEIDTDGDKTADCKDQCPNDPDKFQPGKCGCDVSVCSYVSPVHIIPGKIEAEEFDYGVNGKAYYDNSSGNSGRNFRTNEGDDVDVELSNDTDNGYSVGWIKSGEWLGYQVEIISDGDYDIEFRLSSAVTSPGDFHLELDGKEITSTIKAPATGGWNNWKTITLENVSLLKGKYTMRFVMDSQGYNFNWMKFINRSSVGVNQTNAENHITIYPNPFKSSLTIKLDEASSVSSVEIFELTGKMISKTNFENGSEVILAKGLPKGIYFVKVKSGDDILLTKKVVKY